MISLSSPCLTQPPDEAVQRIAAGEPLGIAAYQSAQLSGTLALPAEAAAKVDTVFRQAYATARDRRLLFSDYGNADPAAWETGRDQLNREAVAAIQALLTPEQARLMQRLGWSEQLLFLLGGGPGAAYRSRNP